MALKNTLVCPTSGKSLNCYFVVYSPQYLNHDTHKLFLDTILSPSPVYFSTMEFGQAGDHPHVNYLYYASSRDAADERRRLLRVFKASKVHFGQHELKVKACSGPNNVVKYMIKEGISPTVLEDPNRPPKQVTPRGAGVVAAGVREGPDESANEK